MWWGEQGPLPCPRCSCDLPTFAFNGGSSVWSSQASTNLQVVSREDSTCTINYEGRKASFESGVQALSQ